MVRCNLSERFVVVIRLVAKFNPGKSQANRGPSASGNLPLVGCYLVPEDGRGLEVWECIFNNCTRFTVSSSC